MSMLRLPTELSRGRANLHQGAIGAGVRIADGRTTSAVMANQMISRHPDTGENVVGLDVPGWEKAVDLAVRAADLTGLGYLGVDIVVDRDRGPLVLELNARPGLAIQIANRTGLKHRLEEIERLLLPTHGLEERIALATAVEAKGLG
jgi:alpha-L-glutamate ligase-like protein